MADIRTRLFFEDNASKTLQSISRELTSIRGQLGKLGTEGGSSFNGASNGAKKLENNTKLVNKEMDKSIGIMRNMRYQVLNIFILAMAVRSLYRTIRSATDKIDDFNLTIKRLEMGLETLGQQGGNVHHLFNEIVESATRSRSSIMDTASTISKLSLQAPHAFESMQEIIHFSEMMNKSFKISNASIESQRAGMYQLTQALASNRLQGDEFRSIIENLPILVTYLNKELGTTHAELKKLSSEGALTADVIKRAVFNATEDINKRFESMPKTFGDHFTAIGNHALVAFKPVFERLQMWANSPEMKNTVDKINDKISNMADNVLNVMNGLEKISAWIKGDGALIMHFLNFVQGVLGTIIAYKIGAKLASLASGVAKLLASNPKLLFVAVVIGLIVTVVKALGISLQGVAYAIGWVIGLFEAMATIAIQHTYVIIVAFVALFHTIIDGIENLVIFIQWGWEVTKLAAAESLTFVGMFFTNVFNHMYNFGATMLEAIVNKFLELRYKAQMVAYNINHSFWQMFQNLGQGIANSINGWISSFEDFANFVVDMINSLIDRFNSSWLFKGVNAVSKSLGFGGSEGFNKVERVSLGRVGNPFAGFAEPQAPDAPETFSIDRKETMTMSEMFGKSVDNFSSALKDLGGPQFNTRYVDSWAKVGSVVGGIFESVAGMPSARAEQFGNFFSEDPYGKYSLLQYPENIAEEISDALEDSPLGGGGGGAGGGGSGGRIGSVGKIEKPIELSDDAMKLLEEMAEKTFHDRYSRVSQEIHVNYVSNNNGSSDENISKNANMISKMILNKLATNMNIS